MSEVESKSLFVEPQYLVPEWNFASEGDLCLCLGSLRLPRGQLLVFLLLDALRSNP
jgi:hypothetical protein